MLHTLLGEEGWRRGMALYVERHDGEAATCDDFVDAMEAASGIDLGQFRRWYSTAGTPELEIEEHHDAEAARYTLTVRQAGAGHAGAASDQAPLHVPLRMGLLDGNGAPAVARAGLAGARRRGGGARCSTSPNGNSASCSSACRGVRWRPCCAASRRR